MHSKNHSTCGQVMKSRLNLYKSTSRSTTAVKCPFLLSSIMYKQPTQAPVVSGYLGQITTAQFIHNAQIVGNYVSVLEEVDVQQKLQQKLKPVLGAWLDKDKICLEGTRTAIIKEISQWIHNNDTQIFFLCGEAGTGKSTISHTIGKLFDNCLGSFFCFDRAFSTKRTPSNALCTIAYELGIKFPEIGSKLLQTLEVNPNILESTDIQELWQTLIVNPAQMMVYPGHPVLIVIDALDESGDQGSRAQLLSLFVKNTYGLPGYFHVLVTSSLESDVVAHLQEEKTSYIQSLKVQYMNSIPDIKNDMVQYVCSRMMENEGSGKLKEDQCKFLAEKAGGLFQWAAIVCTSIHGQGKGGLSISEHFDHFMSLSQVSVNSLHALDELYECILNNAFDVHDQDAMVVYKSIMSQVLAAFEPLSQATLQMLQPEGDNDAVSCVLSLMGPLFTGTSESGNAHVKPVHTSVLDFLLDESRSKQFYVDKNQGHHLLANEAFHVMFRDLHFNMGNFETSYMLNSEIKDFENKLSTVIKPEMIYACSFWDLHLYELEPHLSWIPILEKFCYQHSLYWMEVLGLSRQIHVASRAARNVIEFLDKLKDSSNDLRKFLQEIPEFIWNYGIMIMEATPHLYLSGIPFIPKQSSLHIVYQKCCDFKKQAILSGKVNTWLDQQSIIGGHASVVNAVDFSADGKRIVSASGDRLIRIWNAETGKAIGDPLQGHSGKVTSIVFSPDGSRIVSGSDDETVRIWNTMMGRTIGTPLLGHSGWVTSVAFSPDGSRIISGSADQAIRIWNAETGETIGVPLQGHSGRVTSVALSPDGSKIVSGSTDQTIRIWNAETGKAIGDSLQGHSNIVTAVAFSPDGSRIVSGSWDQSLRIWNAETGNSIGDPLEGHSNITPIPF
ncbi:hypothetical protein F5050DRAFT_1876401 [Lentinula boryana]|uniref:Nephrocystin 3-like N-terminal domain-containing protein n=1 Tax=Lentinula boryana TaxID=40481 RepID=A0ABQ8QGR0_9AGAR|nr:hypothetical protein F5050DRAFT_1876401 [Lentinula boryana]